MLGLLCACLAGPACHASASLDEVLTSLESGGLLSNREQAVHGGLMGILQSIDPGASLKAEGAPPAGSHTPTGAIRSVELWQEDLAYLKLDDLPPGCGPELVTHLMALKDRAGVILDLRGVGGDGLDAVSCLAGIGHQAGDALLVITDNRGQDPVTNSVVNELTLGVPLMVLIDRGTHGAAEALAAVWRGCPGVMLMGSTTRGEACLRGEITLPGGQRALVAARRLMPVHGDSYAGYGVRPTVVVAAASDVMPEPTVASGSDPERPVRPLSRKSEQDRDLMLRVAGDVVLRRATDILLGLRVVNGYGK